MAGRSRSNAEKWHRHALDKEEVLQYAMKLHFEDMEKPEKERRALRTLAHKAEMEMKKLGKDVRVNHVTLNNRIAGGRSCQQANEKVRGWLAAEEDENIIWPFNPHVVSNEMMVPSLAASSQGCPPLPQPSPVRAVTSLLCQFAESTPALPSACHNHAASASNIEQLSSAETEGQEPTLCHSTWSLHPPATLSHMNWHAAMHDTVNALASTSASFLVNKTPLTSSDQLPKYVLISVSPTRKRRHHELLGKEPQSETEQAYQAALRRSDSLVEAYKGASTGMQATVVLQGMFVNHLSGQLQAQEDKQKKQKKGKLNADGLPKLLTGEKFRALVNEHVAAGEKDRIDRENRRKQKEVQSELIAAWKEQDSARKQRNKERQEAYQEELRLWEDERDLAKREKRRVGWAKPKRGKLEGAPQRSWVKGANGVEVEGGNERDSDESMRSDGGSEEE